LSPTAIPKRLIWVGAAAAATFGVMYLRNKFMPHPDDDDFHDARRRRDRGEPEPAKKADDDSPADSAAKKDTASSDNGAAEKAKPAEEKKSDSPPRPGGEQELAEFLAGDSWFDEAGWRGIWEREAVEDEGDWLKTKGKTVLAEERDKLRDHPALLAGCRRRWIVVCRYAGIDVSDAASLWNATDA
jgi:hypothetical protein